MDEVSAQQQLLFLYNLSFLPSLAAKRLINMKDQPRFMALTLSKGKPYYKTM